MDHVRKQDGGAWSKSSWQSDAEHAVKYGDRAEARLAGSTPSRGTSGSARRRGKTLQLARGRRRESVVEIDGKTRDRRRRATPTSRDRPATSCGSVSPDRKWRAAVRDDNVVLKSLETNDEFAHEYRRPGRGRLRRFGSSGRPTRSGWSHCTRNRPRNGRSRSCSRRRAISCATRRRSPFDYLKPGDRVAVTKPSLFDVEARRPIAVSA